MVRNVIVTRMYYDDREMLRKRAELMTETLIPALKAQVKQDFQFIIMSDKFIEDLKEIIDYDFIQLDTFEDLINYCKENAVISQTRVDSDDVLLPHYVHLLDYYLFEKYDQEEILLNFNPLHWDLENDIPLELETRYNNENTSTFLTLINLKHTSHVYAHPHNKMRSYYKVDTVAGIHVLYNEHPDQIMKVPIEERKQLRQTPKKKEQK